LHQPQPQPHEPLLARTLTSPNPEPRTRTPNPEPQPRTPNPNPEPRAPNPGPNVGQGAALLAYLLHGVESDATPKGGWICVDPPPAEVPAESAPPA
jgi:hypothetical protein